MLNVIRIRAGVTVGNCSVSKCEIPVLITTLFTCMCLEILNICVLVFTYVMDLILKRIGLQLEYVWDCASV